MVGHADPVSGYRCRLTVARDWKGTIGMYRKTSSRSELDIFVLPPGPTRGWIEKHVLHRQLADTPIISLIVGPLNPRDIAFHIVKGYPEVTASSQSRMIAHRHLHVDGFPATFVSADEGMGPYRFRRTVLLVYVPDHSMLYVVLGNGGAVADLEVEAIASSFRIEKVLAPPHVKR